MVFAEDSYAGILDFYDGYVTFNAGFNDRVWYFFVKGDQKELNGTFGYRTKRSMKNQET